VVLFDDEDNDAYACELERNIKQGLRQARRKFTMEEGAEGLSAPLYDVGWE
jgi:hypothetical protein